MAAVGKAHIEVVPDLSNFSRRLRRAADAIDSVVDDHAVVVRRKDFDRLSEALRLDGQTVGELHGAAENLIENADTGDTT